MSSSSSTGLPVCSAVLMGLSIIAVGLRFIARKQQRLPFLADDWLALAALIFYIGATISTLIVVSIKGLGYSSHSFTPEEAAAIAKPTGQLEISMDYLQTASIACIKLSALFFYRRVLCVGGISTWLDIATKISIVIIVLWLVVFEFLAGFQCGTHLSAEWDGNYLKYCYISFPWLYGLTISDVLLDIWILALPIPLVARLHTSRAKRLSILGIFLLAFVGLGAGIARMAILIEGNLGGPTYYITHDEELQTTTYEFYTMLENGMSLVAVNLPSLWQVCTRVIPEKAASSFRSMASLLSMRNSRRAGFATRMDSDDLTAKPSASAASSDHSVSLKNSLKLRDDVESNTCNIYALHDFSNTQDSHDMDDMSKDAVYVQDTVELHHH